jgi:ribonuclease P protein component
MSASLALSLNKEERICSKKLIDELFNGGGSHAMSAFPLRVVYLTKTSTQKEESTVSILVSVPKRYFKRAVKRNRVKRQIREAYRKNKVEITENSASKGLSLFIAFIWLDSKLHPSTDVEEKVKGLLARINENL